MPLRPALSSTLTRRFSVISISSPMGARPVYAQDVS